jgi:hypothetical protein
MQLGFLDNVLVDNEVKDGLYHYIERMVVNLDEHDKIHSKILLSNENISLLAESWPSRKIKESSRYVFV